MSFYIDLINLVFCSCLFLVGSFVQFSGIENYHANSLYNLVLLFLVLIISLRSITNKKIQINLSFKSFVYLLLIALIGIYISVFFNGSREVWLDEYTQFIRTTFTMNHIYEEKNLSLHAAYEQQPFGGYYFSSFCYFVFGISEWSIRLQGYLFYILIGLFTFGASREIGKSEDISFLGSVLALTLPLFMFFSIEARPLMMSCFYALMYLYVCFEYFERKGNILTFTATNIIYTLTIGLQPLIIIFTMSLFLFLNYYKAQKKRALKFFSANAITALTFFPQLYLIYEKSMEMKKFNFDENNGFLSGLRNFDFSVVLTQFLDHSPIHLSILLAFIFLGLYVRKKEKSYLFKNPFEKSLVSTLFVFPILFLLIFYISIKWFLVSRYFINFYVIIIFFTLLIMPNHLFKKYHPYKVFSLCIIVFTFWGIDSLSSRPYFRSYHQEKDLKELYSYIESRSTKEDLAIHFNFVELGKWRGAVWTSKEVYAKNYSIYYLANTTNVSGLYIPFEKFEKKSNFKIFFVERIERSRFKDFLEKFFNSKDIQYKMKTFALYKVVEVEFNGDNFIFWWRSFLRDMGKFVPNNYSYAFLEAEIQYLLEEDNNNEAEKLIDHYKAISTKALSDGNIEISARAQVKQNIDTIRALSEKNKKIRETKIKKNGGEGEI